MLIPNNKKWGTPHRFTDFVPKIPLGPRAVPSDGLFRCLKSLSLLVRVRPVVATVYFTSPTGINASHEPFERSGCGFPGGRELFLAASLGGPCIAIVAKNVCNVDEMRPLQVLAMQTLFSQTNNLQRLLAVLPTGYGKSLLAKSLGVMLGGFTLSYTLS